MSSARLPHTEHIESLLRLAGDLELAAEERAELGDAREANELRQRAAAVRSSAGNYHNFVVEDELERAKNGETINLSDLMAGREAFES